MRGVNFTVAAMHGEMPQEERDEIMTYVLSPPPLIVSIFVFTLSCFVSVRFEVVRIVC